MAKKKIKDEKEGRFMKKISKKFFMQEFLRCVWQEEPCWLRNQTAA